MKRVILCSAALLSATVAAEGLKTEGELGYVATTGNTETTTTNAKLGLSKETEAWKYAANFAAIGASSENSDGEEDTTAEKYNLNLKADRKLEGKSFFFVLGTAEKDRFTGFEYQNSLGIGYGYKVLDDDVNKLSFEIGPGYRYSKLKEGESTEEATWRLAQNYERAISESATFKQYANVEGGDQNRIFKYGLSIESKMTAMLGLKAGIDAVKNSDAPEGTEETDTTTSVTLTFTL